VQTVTIYISIIVNVSYDRLLQISVFQLIHATLTSSRFLASCLLLIKCLYLFNITTEHLLCKIKHYNIWSDYNVTVLTVSEYIYP